MCTDDLECSVALTLCCMLCMLAVWEVAFVLSTRYKHYQQQSETQRDTSDHITNMEMYRELMFESRLDQVYMKGRNRHCSVVDFSAGEHMCLYGLNISPVPLQTSMKSQPPYVLCHPVAAYHQQHVIRYLESRYLKDPILRYLVSNLSTTSHMLPFLESVPVPQPTQRFPLRLTIRQAVCTDGAQDSQNRNDIVSNARQDEAGADDSIICSCCQIPGIPRLFGLLQPYGNVEPHSDSHL
nr:hypothetical protein CFP56_30017 [Quercus suber]